MHDTKRKGFSLVELILYTVAILVIIAIVIPRGDDTITASKKKSDYAQIVTISTAISQYKFEIGNYPPNQAALLTQNGVYGPWLVSLPTSDIWGTTNSGINGSGGASAYCYAYTANGFAVWSLGANKVNNSGGGGTTLPTAFSGDDYGVLEK
jgi:type II secretory pathway pseudopilin PulG